MIKIVCIIPSACTDKTILYLKQCIRSLKISEKGNVQLMILVVSANTDARKLLVRESIDNFYLVDSTLGFAQMNNVAIEESLALYASDYYLFINDDAYVQKNFFAVLTHIISDATSDIICPLIYKPDGSIDSFGIEYFTSGYATNAQNIATHTTLTQAACVLVKTTFVKKILNQYGYFFNPLLHSYYEDSEFSIRARAIGAHIDKTTTLVAFHRGSSSYGPNSARVKFYTFRNVLWVIWLTWPKKYILQHITAIFLTQLWFIYCSVRDGAWWIYPRLCWDTIKYSNLLCASRRRTIQTYGHFHFASIFSPYVFRTRQRGIPIRPLFSFNK
jgi:GT2 family glycosyltransferase